MRKNLILLGTLTGIILLAVAMLCYPGGSPPDAHSVGYSFWHNYMSNLFSPKAMDGADNLARPWASAGMFFLALSFGYFFIKFSKNIDNKGASKVIRYCGVAAVICTFLTVTPLHDAMLPILSTLTLIACFYITVFIFKTKLHLFKVFSVVMMLLFYASVYLYFSSTYLDILPVIQKLSAIINIAWVLCLEYFTDRRDFEGVTR
ncbi:hypothetical protein [Mucilaginibacter sp. PPCGB 2223]|uniref:hypothetical protein n=1 Tax=Mucilaginibacter sp. PPCGB 2223 TaxID=1886027 RepID=UPI0011120B0E|nr:hypothetical protein [Mucilaginibacter sp. PPCGB 2223]